MSVKDRIRNRKMEREGIGGICQSKWTIVFLWGLGTERKEMKEDSPEVFRE